MNKDKLKALCHKFLMKLNIQYNEQNQFVNLMSMEAID